MNFCETFLFKLPHSRCRAFWALWSYYPSHVAMVVSNEPPKSTFKKGNKKVRWDHLKFWSTVHYSESTQVIVIGILLTMVQLCHKLLHRYGLSRLRSPFYEDFDQTIIVMWVCIWVLTYMNFTSLYFSGNTISYTLWDSIVIVLVFHSVGVKI